MAGLSILTFKFAQVFGFLVDVEGIRLQFNAAREHEVMLRWDGA